MKCPRCGCEDNINVEGSLSCAKCYIVLEENNIVSEVTFSENSSGGATVLGTFVSATGEMPRSQRRGFSKESRELTIENGKRTIRAVAASLPHQLSLKQKHIDEAGHLFRLAVEQKFTQGRRPEIVVAACLYLVCRRTKTPHLLVDFSDSLHIDLNILGQTFLQLCRKLYFQPPVIDPSLYIERFVKLLDFEGETNAIVNTALRLVQRMKRDWIQTGRRPSGICGASILIASRLHGFQRTQKEIINIVKISDSTLRRRLIEFATTPSGSLTREEFESIDLEEECNPPSFQTLEETEVNSEIGQDFDANEIEKEMSETLNSSEFQQLEREEANLRSQSENQIQNETQTQNQEESEENNESSSQFPKPNSSPSQIHIGNKRPRDEGDFSDLDDKEIESYIIRSDDEVQKKAEIWEELNKEWIAKQEAKELEMGANPQKKRRQSKKDAPKTAAEATLQMLKKRVSSKINYSALENIFDFDQNMFDPKKSFLQKVQYQE